MNFKPVRCFIKDSKEESCETETFTILHNKTTERCFYHVLSWLLLGDYGHLRGWLRRLHEDIQYWEKEDGGHLSEIVLSSQCSWKEELFWRSFKRKYFKIFEKMEAPAGSEEMKKNLLQWQETRFDPLLGRSWRRELCLSKYSCFGNSRGQKTQRGHQTRSQSGHWLGS